jgi:aminoglycoside phosphotransferase (APT) family kinase protein
MGNISDLQKALNAWAASFYEQNAEISDLKRLSGGASQETWAFDVINTGHGRQELILRRAPGGVARARSSEAILLADEAKLLQLAADANVTAPVVVAVFAPGSDVGEAFIMHRIAGETLARRILRDDKYTAARTQLPAQCGRELARIHSISPSNAPFLPVSGGADQIKKYETIFREFDFPRPVFELALKWLKDNLPPPTDPVLVHGDFRIGNLIVGETGLTSVLDWELAHIGDPREDIAWICVNSWRFGQRDNRVGGFGHLPELLDAYAEENGHRYEEAEIDWWETLGSLKWGIMCMIMFEAYRSGADPSVERAAIGRRVSETEIDLLNLLEKAI